MPDSPRTKRTKLDDGKDFTDYEERANLLEKDDNNENGALKMESEHGENFSDASSSNTDDGNAGQSPRANFISYSEYKITGKFSLK